MVSIQFLGAAGTVTGSKHLLKTPEKNILIDCGLFQGIKQLREKNRQPLPVDAGEIDLVILTHAHLDHSGHLPLLMKAGYKGKVIMTPPTKDLAEIILLDSAKIQEEDAERSNRFGYSKHKPALPLYTVKDAEQVIRKFEVVDINTWSEITPDIKFRFIRNGHILGSAFIEFLCHGKKIFFSGDIGRSNSKVMFPPETIEECDYLVMESTYGDRNHNPAPAENGLADIINETLKDKGNLLIPSFAVGRAQELMHLVNELKDQVRIPDVPVFMDSPMGAKITRLLEKYPEWHMLNVEECRAIFERVKIISDFKETIQTIEDKHLKIVIAASGMLTGGRVLEYLKNYIGDSRNTVLLVGYQAEGTRGRSLQNGAHEIKLYGKYYQINTKVKEMSSMSAHADQNEMINWLRSIKKKPQKIFLVHGEPAARDAFRIKIADEFKIDAMTPMQNDELQLF